MQCLVCHQSITINRFQELLALESPLLCAGCQQHLIRKKGVILFEGSDWMDGVLARLEKGDIILTQLFIPAFYHEVKKQLKDTHQITILNLVSTGPYPWLVILLNQVKQRLLIRDQKEVQFLLVSIENSTNQTIRIT